MRLRDISTAARIELLEPMSQRPSRRYLVQLATTNLQSFFNEIVGTGRPWAICDQPITLTVASGESEYLLQVGSDWGRPLDVTTMDTSNPSFIERQIEFTELADQKFDFQAPRNTQSFIDSAGHTAQRISFFKKGFGDDQYCSVWPVPIVACSYRIIYSLGNFASEMSLDDSPLLAMHHNLLAVKTALDALPGSAWFVSEAENRLRRNELRTSLSERMVPLMEYFRKWVRNTTQPRMTMRNTYAIE